METGFGEEEIHNFSSILWGKNENKKKAKLESKAHTLRQRLSALKKSRPLPEESE